MTNKLVFESDGSYHRSGPVDEMDIQVGKKSTLSEIAAKPKEVRSATKKHVTTGGFDLSALRASAKKAANSVSKTTLPAQGDTQFESVATVPVVPVNQKSKVVADKKEADSADGQKVSNSVDNVSKPKRSPKTIKAKPSTDVKPEEDSMIESAEHTENATAAGTEEEKVVVATQQKVDSSASLEVRESKVVDQTAAQEMILDSSEATAPEETTVIEEVTAPEKTTVIEEVTAPEEAVSKKEEVSAGGFKMIPLSDFLVVAATDEYALAKWCLACITKAASNPATIFCASFNQDLRFYNFFAGKSADWIGVVVGYADSIACMQLHVKSLVMQDAKAAVTCTGDAVKKEENILVLYEEKTHTARRV